MITKKLLGATLTDMGLITKEDLEKALQKQRTNFGEKTLPERLQRIKLVSEARMASDTTQTLGQILTDMGFATREHLALALKKQDEMIEAYTSLKSEKLAIVIEEGSIINSTLNIAEVLKRILKHVNQVTDSAASTLMLLDNNTGELVFSVPTGPKSDKLTDMHLPRGKGIAGWVAENDQHVLIPDVNKDSRFYPKVDEITGFETKSILCVPLKAKSKMIGVLEAINKTNGSPFTEDDALLLNIFANQAAIAIENARCCGELKDKLEQEKQMQKKLAESEKLRALGLMASGMAHDFNNMLAIILGNADLIQITEDRDTILKKAQIIKQAAIDSTNVIKRLQKFTKSKEDDGKFQSVNINDIVKGAIELTTHMWKGTPQKKGINIEIKEQLSEEELIILGNSSDLREVITNLVFNSVDAMPQGGEINITTYVKYENIYMKISDSGIGMTEEIKNRIFDPFFTTKGVTHSGLGMSMLYGIIKRHNGNIEVDTKPGKGTTFIISFPRQKEIIKKSDEKTDIVIETKKANILVIDDEPEIRVMLLDILSRLGHQTDVFASGKMGIEALKKGNYNILLTDLGMPEISGWEVVNIAKEIKPNVIIGMITGWDIAHDKAKEKGVDFILHKPFQKNQIVQAITNALKSKDD